MQERQKVLQSILEYLSNSILKTDYGVIELELNAGKNYIDIIKKERKRFFIKNEKEPKDQKQK